MQLDYTIPGILVFAQSDLNESTTASNMIRCISVFETDNVHNFLNTLGLENLSTKIEYYPCKAARQCQGKRKRIQ